MNNNNHECLGSDQVMQAAAELCQEQQSRSLASAQLQQSLDYATIQLCISLLDHFLFNTIYSSIMVVFLAVRGMMVSEILDYRSIRIPHLAIPYIIPYISLPLSRHPSSSAFRE
jgi:hypothetical protein